MIKNVFLRKIIKLFADWLTPFPSNSGYKNWTLKNLLLRLAGINISRTGVAIDRGFQCIDGNEDNVTFDSYAVVGHDFKLWNFDRVIIGKFCMIAAGVTVSNGWHDKSTLEPSSGKVSIGAGCWIGTNATIIGSVTIGQNSIVAAGALVNKDISPNSIVAGVPAKVISMRKLPDRVWHLNNLYFCPHEFKILSS